MSEKRDAIWYLVNCIQRAVGGGVAKKVILVAYFDAQGNCMGHEEVQVIKIYPKEIFRKLTSGAP